MKKPISDKWYTASEAGKFIGLSRPSIANHIKLGRLQAIKSEGEKSKKRYMLKGEWINSFIEKRKDKVATYEAEALTMCMGKVLDYCTRKRILTIKQLKRVYEKRN